jgi:Tfp pilus assembly protein PilX
MLNAKRSLVVSRVSSHGQGGAVLFIAIAVVVVMTLAGIALVRSIDTSNLIAGNLAFHESATNSGDTGVETAIAWLQANSTGATLNADNPTNGYAANGINAAQSPAAGQSWDAYWTATLASRARTLSTNGAGNTVSYVIDRMCSFSGAPTAGATCASSPLPSAATGSAEVAGKLQLNVPSLVYYRITARITGPRSTVSYVQATVAL